jgi:hypothetical protein
MPTPSTTRLDYGNPLGWAEYVAAPQGSITCDAYGLVQSQLVFTVDSADEQIVNVLNTASFANAPYPYNIGIEMTAYKYAISFQPGGVATVTIDFVGIKRESGITDCQITGVSNTTAQPIETHPNFTVVTDDTIGNQSPTQILAGPPSQPSSNPNKPIFIPSGDVYAPWRFDGFGLAADGTRNRKAGIRHFLRPMYSVRGVVFFNRAQGYRAAAMTNGVGRTLSNEDDMFKLITPNDILGALSPDLCLLTAANAECIGSPDYYGAIKVTYDIMIGGELGWDSDIYGPMASAIFG